MAGLAPAILLVGGAPRLSGIAGTSSVMARTSILIRVFFKDRLDRIVPFAEVFFEQFFSRRDATRDRFFERTQIARLIAAVAIKSFAAPEPARTKPQRLLRQREYISVANLGLEAE